MQIMAKKIALSTIIVALSYFCSRCQPEQKRNNQPRFTEAKEGQISGEIKASIKRVLTIERDWFDYGSIFLDREGNIIYWQGRDGKVAKFDSTGSLILLKQLHSGQGPGDLNFFDFDEFGGKYYVWDKGPNQRLNIFDKEFNLISTSDLRARPSEGRSVMRIDRSGNIYFIYSVSSVIMLGMLDEIGIWNFGKNGKRRTAKYFEVVSRQDLSGFAKPSVNYSFVQPFLRYQIEDNGDIWACDRRDYKIYQYRSDGVEKNVISKEFEKLSLKGELASRFNEDYEIDKIRALGIEAILPEYICPVMDFLLIDSKYLLVLKMDNIYREDLTGRVPADLFSISGEYLCQLEMPEFWAGDALNNQFKTNICYKNGNLFTLETEKTFEKFWINKYELKIETIAR